jgi:hypothetical protein
LQYLLSICNIFWPFAIYFDHWEYLMTIGNILWPLGISYDHWEYFYGHLVLFMLICYSFWSFGIFSRFGMFGPRKIWQPCSKIQTFALAQENFNFRIDLSTSALELR